MAIQTINLGTYPTGVGSDTNYIANGKTNQNFTNSTHAASRLVGTAAGNVMEVGAFGLGAEVLDPTPIDLNSDNLKCGFYSAQFINKPPIQDWSMMIHIPLGSVGSKEYSSQILFDLRTDNVWHRRRMLTHKPWVKFYDTANTTTDANGFIKAASPVVKLFADHIETNETSALQNITFEKLGAGDYLLKNTTGFADEGWYIEMPKDANGNVLVAVVYKELDNKDISVKTYAKTFDEETGDIIPNISRPRDIPANRWIDIRLNELPTADAPVLPVTGG